MLKPIFYENVNYEHLPAEEKRIKATRELFAIFYLNKGKGLTDMEIHFEAERLEMTGYKNMARDSVIRNKIYCWNDMAIKSVTGGTTCNYPEGCKKICSWGFEKNKPSRCEKHKEEHMKRVVEERLIKHPKVEGTSKGKYYLDDAFAKRIFGADYAPVIESIDNKSVQDIKGVDSNSDPINCIPRNPQSVPFSGSELSLSLPNQSVPYLTSFDELYGQGDFMQSRSFPRFDFNEYIRDLNLDKPVTYDLNLNLNINLDSFETNNNLLGSFNNIIANPLESFTTMNSFDGSYGDFDTLNIPKASSYGHSGYNVENTEVYAGNGMHQYFDNTFGSNIDGLSTDQLEIDNIWNEHFGEDDVPLTFGRFPDTYDFQGTSSNVDLENIENLDVIDKKKGKEKQHSYFICSNEDTGKTEEELQLEKEADELFNLLIGGEDGFSNVNIPFLGNPLLMNIEMESQV